MSMDRNAVDDARAEDEAFAQVVREQGKERLERRLEAVRQYRFDWLEGDGLRARLGGDVDLAGEVARLAARVAALEARIAVLEGGQRTY